MKLQKLSGLLLVLLCVLYGACTDREIPRIYPLTFEKGEYELRERMTLSVTFRSGNKDYTVVSSDTAVVKASTDSKIGFGTLYLLGNGKGEAIVSVKDNVSNEKIDLRVTVTDFFLGFEVVDTDNVIFQKNDCLFFVKNESKDFLALGKTDTIDGTVLRFRGNYEFAVTGGKHFVHIEYEKEGQPVKYAFDMTGSSSEIFSMIEHFYQPDMVKAKDIGPRYYFMNLEERTTGSKLVCLLRDVLLLPQQ